MKMSVSAKKNMSVSKNDGCIKSVTCVVMKWIEANFCIFLRLTRAQISSQHDTTLIGSFELFKHFEGH